MSKWLTKQTLLIRAQNQDDSQAWDEFVDYYKEFILIVILKLNVNTNDLEDLSQEILLKIWKNLDKYQASEYQFRSWLNRLIRNKVVDYIRTKSRIGRLEGDSLDNDEKSIDLPLSEIELEKIIEKEWRVYLTNRALQNIEPLFSEQAMQAFKMSLGGIPVKEITEKLKLAEGSVYTLRKRVQERLLAEVVRLKDEIEL